MAARMLKWCVKACLAGIVSMLLLTMFQAVYSYTGIHVFNPSGSTDYVWEPNQRIATMGEGFAWLKLDKNGYNNVYDCADKPDILLMGSSHMEAINVGASENTGFLLNKGLSYSTYNIGISGHTIYTCVKNLEAAVKEFQPQKYIIIETDRVDLSDNDMQAVLDDEYATIPSYDEGIIYTIQKKFPVIKTLYKKITDWKDAEVLVSDRTDSGMAEVEINSILLNRFMAKVKSAVDDTEIKIIIFYQPKTMIDSEGKYIETSEYDAVNCFAEACKNNDIIFVDMSESFKELYDNENILAHGFSNTAVGVGHLNKYGHKVVADRLIAAIIEEENK